MKFHSFRYLVGEGFKNTWVNRLMTLASIGVLVACMVVIGLADLVAQNINQALQGLQKQNVVVAFMEDYNWARFGEKTEKSEKAGIPDETEEKTDAENETPEKKDSDDYSIKNDKQAQKLFYKIGDLKGVKNPVFIADVYALDYMKKFMSDEEYNDYQKLSKKNDNPYPRGIYIENVSSARMDSLIEKLESMEGVGGVYKNGSDLAVYLEDENWALCHELIAKTKTDDSAAPAKKVKNDKPDKNGIRYSDYAIHDEKEAKALCDQIAQLDNVNKVEFISSTDAFDEAIQFMSKQDSKYFKKLKKDGENPISCAAKISMEDMGKFDTTLEQIAELEGIDVIRSHRDAASKIEALKKGITFAGFAIMVILIAISLMIVSNTIRITMYNRKLEISIMKAVGATNAFIRIPFVVEGILIGIFSALISEATVYFCYRVATETISKTIGGNVVSFASTSLRLLSIFLIIGVAAGAFGSFIMIRKYLRREGSEFAAI